MYPGQTAFFVAERSNGTWDYNCNGLDEIGLTRTGSACAGTDPATCMASPSGWNGTTPPGCGQGAVRSVCNYTTTLGCFGGPAYTDAGLSLTEAKALPTADQRARVKRAATTCFLG